jgi:hypothetical protein
LSLREALISGLNGPAQFLVMKILDVPQSGSIAGVTSSRNRFGQYRRTRAIPVNPSSDRQGTIRARFGDLSQAWRDLTEAQRAGWANLGLSYSRTDALGQVYSLDGQQAFISVNMANLDAGNAIVNDAPGMIAPTGLLTVTITSTGGTLSAAYTATPLSAGCRLFSYASPQRSPGRNYESDLRLIEVSAAAAASPANLLASYTARFGAPVVGQKIHFSFQVYEGGFLSAPLQTSHVIVA